MRKFGLLTLLAALALVVALLWAVAPERSAAQEDEPTPVPAERRSISVSATGRASAQPDVAVVRLGVETDAEEAAAALAQNNEQMQALIDALSEAGVADEDLRTQTIQLFPRYQEPRPLPDTAATQSPTATQELLGYRAINVVEVHTEDLEGLGELIDTAVQAGGNRVQGIRFEVSEQTAFLDQAREAAWNDAQHKAEHLAELAGVELGQVLTINESSFFPPVYARGEVEFDAAAVPVEPGTQDITVDLHVVWSIVITPTGGG